MTTTAETGWRGLVRQPWFALFAPLVFGVAVFGAGVMLFALPVGKTEAEHRLCDQAVAALLHNKDLVEVQRAGIIIREIPCGIGRRLREADE